MLGLRCVLDTHMEITSTEGMRLGKEPTHEVWPSDAQGHQRAPCGSYSMEYPSAATEGGRSWQIRMGPSKATHPSCHSKKVGSSH